MSWSQGATNFWSMVDQEGNLILNFFGISAICYPSSNQFSSPVLILIPHAFFHQCDNIFGLHLQSAINFLFPCGISILELNFLMYNNISLQLINDFSLSYLLITSYSTFFLFLVCKFQLNSAILFIHVLLMMLLLP